MKKKPHMNHSSASNNRKPWTEADERLFNYLSQILPDGEIAKQMGRTVPAVWQHRAKTRTDRAIPESQVYHDAN